ncbi:MAG: hypothetical protein WCG45_04430, partial [bacterium]
HNNLANYIKNFLWIKQNSFFPVYEFEYYKEQTQIVNIKSVLMEFKRKNSCKHTEITWISIDKLVEYSINFDQHNSRKRMSAGDHDYKCQLNMDDISVLLDTLILQKELTCSLIKLLFILIQIPTFVDVLIANQRMSLIFANKIANILISSQEEEIIHIISLKIFTNMFVHEGGYRLMIQNRETIYNHLSIFIGIDVQICEEVEKGLAKLLLNYSIASFVENDKEYRINYIELVLMFIQQFKSPIAILKTLQTIGTLLYEINSDIRETVERLNLLMYVKQCQETRQPNTYINNCISTILQNWKEYIPPKITETNQ